MLSLLTGGCGARHTLVVRLLIGSPRQRHLSVELRQRWPRAHLPLVSRGLCIHVPLSSDWMDFILSGLAGCAACLFSNPLEVVKTRMQLQGELCARGTYSTHYRNAFQAMYAIARKDGALALQRGLSAGLLYQFCMNGVRLGTYAALESAGHTKGPIRSPLAGAAAGVMGALIGSPAYLVKTHLQTQSASEIAVGHQHPHRGMVHAFCSIYKEHGLLGLWRGAGAAVPRVTVGSAAQLSCFSFSKEMVNNLKVFSPDSWLVALCAGMISSVALVVAMTPFDVISTRIYNQPVDPRGKGLMYRGVLDCFSKTIRNEGFLGLYKGIGASYFRTGPHTILSLLFWNELRKHYYQLTIKR
ncbi:solute carrier family 25 member 35-like [Ambystoma mexicanum]|uniref:solute carrier family 25 member 35-like n=1 Tax=Ambystoma mexicanum TaxID=8296 RepID=UPI0037E80910